MALTIAVGILWMAGRYWWRQDSFRISSHQQAAMDDKKPQGHTLVQAGQKSGSHSPAFADKPSPKPERTNPVDAVTPDTDDCLEIRLLARSQKISGDRLWAMAKKAGLTFNSNNLLQKKDAERGVDFQLANIMAPGVFDPSTISELVTDGLVFFMVFRETRQAAASFASMVEFMLQAAGEFKAELLSADNRPLRTEDLEEYHRNLSQ